MKASAKLLLSRARKVMLRHGSGSGKYRKAWRLAMAAQAEEDLAPHRAAGSVVPALASSPLIKSSMSTASYCAH